MTSVRERGGPAPPAGLSADPHRLPLNLTTPPPSPPAAAVARGTAARQIVAELDRYIVGQDAAKKAVAIAVRNRWRRAQAPDDIRDEITPVQHHHDRPHRRREDGGRAPAGAAGRRALPQGRGLEVHRGGLRGPRRRVDGARPGRCRDQHGAHRAGGRGLSPGRVARGRAAARPAAAGAGAAPRRDGRPEARVRGGLRRARPSARRRGRAPRALAREAQADAADGKLDDREVEIEVRAAELSRAGDDAAAAGNGGHRLQLHRVAAGDAAQAEEAAHGRRCPRRGAS